MSKTTQIKTRKWELTGVMQNIHKKPKGSKHCNQPHTEFRILTRPITNEEMDALVFGGCYGAKVCLKIEVLIEKPPNERVVE